MLTSVTWSKVLRSASHDSLQVSASLPDAGPELERTLKPVTFPAQTPISKRLLRHHRVVNYLRLGVETRSSTPGISSNGRVLVDSISEWQTRNNQGRTVLYSAFS